MQSKRLDNDLRSIASNIGKAQETTRTIFRIFDTNDLVGVDPLEVCNELYGYLRNVQSKVSIMLAINNGIYKPKPHLERMK